MGECSWNVLMAKTDLKARAHLSFKMKSFLAWCKHRQLWWSGLKTERNKYWWWNKIRKFSLAWCWTVNLVSNEWMGVNSTWKPACCWFTQLPKQVKYENWKHFNSFLKSLISLDFVIYEIKLKRIEVM